MIVRLYSDLHLDGRVYTINPQAHDSDAVLIIAGDTSGFNKNIDFVVSNAERFRYVLFIAGNHEFYGGDYAQVRAFWVGVDKNIDNFLFMDNRVEIIDDVRFIGTTLWTDIDKGNPLSCMIVQRAMNDYTLITHNNRRLLTSDTVGFYNTAMRFLEDELVSPFDGNTVVITHHSPSHTLVTHYHRGSLINGGFHSNSDRLFYDYKINYWFYGHTHVSTNVMIENTHVMSNQRGYYGEDYYFDHDFWLDI